jgi:hypothetical protein
MNIHMCIQRLCSRLRVRARRAWQYKLRAEIYSLAAREHFTFRGAVTPTDHFVVRKPPATYNANFSSDSTLIRPESESQ